MKTSLTVHPVCVYSEGKYCFLYCTVYCTVRDELREEISIKIMCPTLQRGLGTALHTEAESSVSIHKN